MSELVTNALIHDGDSPVTLELETRGTSIRVAVSDDSPELPEIRSSSPSEPSGRGLQIVRVLASATGVERVPGDGKRIWADIPLP